MPQDPRVEGRANYEQLMDLFEKVLEENERIIAQILIATDLIDKKKKEPVSQGATNSKEGPHG